ncbi:Leucine-rich repeat protein [Mactra antiquata]
MKQIDVFENKHLSTEMVKNVCNDLLRDRTEMLSIRNCKLADKDFKKLCKSVGSCRSIRHLALTVNVVCDSFRVQVLAQGLQKNSSLIGLHLNGHAVTDPDMKSLYPYLYEGNRLTMLDLSDGKIGDDGLDVISCLLKQHKGLSELTLSHNPNITRDGWSKFGMAIAAGTSLRTLGLDYNDIGDTVTCCLATALPGAANLEYLDLECTGITDQAAKVLLHLVKTHNSKLKKINLKRNRIMKSITEAIKLHLTTNNNDRVVSDDEEGSLTTSEPPIIKPDEYIQNGSSENRSSYVETDFADQDIDDADLECIPIVEVSPASKYTEPMNDHVTKFDNLIGGSKSMVDIELNKKDSLWPGIEVKRTLSLTDLRRAVRNDMVLEKPIADTCNCTEEKSIENQNHLHVPDADALREETNVTLAVQDIEDDLDFDLTKLDSLSPHSIKGFDETDDTSKSGDVSPGADHRQDTASVINESNDDIEIIDTAYNKHLVVASVESIVNTANETKSNGLTNTITVQPMGKTMVTNKNEENAEIKLKSQSFSSLASKIKQATSLGLDNEGPTVSQA